MAQAVDGLADVAEELLRLVKPGKKATRRDLGVATNLAVATRSLSASVRQFVVMNSVQTWTR